MSRETIIAMEEMLEAAMLGSDVQALDRLLADDLVFTSHTGQILSKSDDLEAHRSGFVRIRSIRRSEQQVRLLGDTAVVTVLSAIRGEFGGVASEADLRFTRVWHKGEKGQWQLAAAHSTLAAL